MNVRQECNEIDKMKRILFYLLWTDKYVEGTYIGNQLGGHEINESKIL